MHKKVLILMITLVGVGSTLFAPHGGGGHHGGGVHHSGHRGYGGRGRGGRGYGRGYGRGRGHVYGRGYGYGRGWGWGGFGLGLGLGWGAGWYSYPWFTTRADYFENASLRQQIRALQTEIDYLRNHQVDNRDQRIATLEARISELESKKPQA